jgi:hypothetical protein
VSITEWWEMGRPLLPERFYRKNGDLFGELNRLGRFSNAWKHHTRLLRPAYLAWMLSRPEPGCAPYPRVVWCRFRGHPRGEVYYNPGGLEPDHSCRDCGETIG